MKGCAFVLFLLTHQVKRGAGGSEASRLTLQVSPIFARVKSFPYEGKGDHVVVDEVKDRVSGRPYEGKGDRGSGG